MKINTCMYRLDTTRSLPGDQQNVSLIEYMLIFLFIEWVTKVGIL